MKDADVRGGSREVVEHEEPLGALDGIRVLDVAAPSGAYVSRVLGDLGADVVKIEPPGGRVIQFSYRGCMTSSQKR